jgi:hypothetical protein
MLRGAKQSKIEVVGPKEGEEENGSAVGVSASSSLSVIPPTLHTPISFYYHRL